MTTAVRPCRSAPPGATFRSGGHPRVSQRCPRVSAVSAAHSPQPAPILPRPPNRPHSPEPRLCPSVESQLIAWGWRGGAGRATAAQAEGYEISLLILELGGVQGRGCRGRGVLYNRAFDGGRAARRLPFPEASGSAARGLNPPGRLSLRSPPPLQAPTAPRPPPPSGEGRLTPGRFSHSAHGPGTRAEGARELRRDGHPAPAPCRTAQSTGR